MPRPTTKHENFTAAPGRVIVAVGPYCWGKGADAKTAIANARKNRVRIYEGNAGFWYILFDAPASAYVDEMGSLRWQWQADELAPPIAVELWRHPRAPKKEAE